MTVSDLRRELQRLEREGHGTKPVIRYLDDGFGATNPIQGVFIENKKVVIE